MVWPGAHDMVYGMTWRALMAYGMVYGLAWRACNGTWHGLASLIWYIDWPSGHRMVYMVRVWQARHWAWHSIWYGLPGMAYGMAWRARNGV